MVTLYRIAGRFHAFLMPAPQSLERFLYRHAWPRILERLLDLLAHVSCELRRLGLVFLAQAQGALDDGVGGGIGARLDASRIARTISAGKVALIVSVSM